MKKSTPPTYSVRVKDQIVVSDKNYTFKQWFNGVKHFFTVKVLPPRQK